MRQSKHTNKVKHAVWECVAAAMSLGRHERKTSSKLASPIKQSLLFVTLGSVSNPVFVLLEG